MFFQAITSHKCTPVRETYGNLLLIHSHHGTSDGSEPHISCAGCLLNGVLRKEADHYKQEKRDIMRSWLVGPDGLNKDDLARHLQTATVDKSYFKPSSLLISTWQIRQLLWPVWQRTQWAAKAYHYEERSGKTTALQRSPEIYNQAPVQAMIHQSWKIRWTWPWDWAGEEGPGWVALWNCLLTLDSYASIFTPLQLPNLSLQPHLFHPARYTHQLLSSPTLPFLIISAYCVDFFMFLQRLFTHHIP